ncbi:MAG: proteasome accessory factor PafA2 family protein [Planctomycetaceae bacterium]|nr:proteasome accessory factor PafA2 family protein [Planctomycetaceae bacterium]
MPTQLAIKKSRLFGLETEYAFAAPGANGVRVASNVALPHLLQAVRELTPTLPDRRSHVGMFLANGSRLYIDCGHPELATAEVTTPTDLCRYVLAGDALLQSAAKATLRQVRSIRSIYLGRSNIGYGSNATSWGCHESYSYTSAPAEIQRLLIPHFVSRIIYTGAGGFDNQSAGIEFLTSPRVSLLRKAVSERSTADRGIFHTKFEPLNAAGQHRLHVICGEGVRSHTSMWLKAATTALLLALYDSGSPALRKAAELTLANPVGAMRNFAYDPEGRARAELSNDRTRRTAIEIQRHFLHLVEQSAGDAILPEWAPLACQRWREILDRLEEGPDAVARTLDWSIKRALFHQHSARRGVPPETWRVWTTVLLSLRRALDQAVELNETLNPEISPDVLRADHPIAGRVREMTSLLKTYDLGWEQLEHVLQVRQELFALDTRYSEIGGSSLFESMDRAGVLEHAYDEVTDIEGAVQNAPPGGRAELRGRELRRLWENQKPNPPELGKFGQGRILCDWEGFWDYAQGKVLSLDDPFTTRASWREMTPEEKMENFGSAAPIVSRLLSQVLSLYDQGNYEQASARLSELQRIHHLLQGSQRRDYCRYTAWIQSRRGYLDAEPALREVFSDETEDISEIGDIVCALRYQGLCPPRAIDLWVERAERLLASAGDGHSSAVPLLGHLGYCRLRRGRRRAALQLLRAASNGPDFASVHPHVGSRILADLGDAYRAVGRRERATECLERAEARQREMGYFGDLADLTLTYRAKLATSPTAALELLEEAKGHQIRLGNRMGEARTLLLEARIREGAGPQRALRARLAELRSQLPALQECRMTRRITRNWLAWISGGPTIHSRDRFWSL